MAAREEPDGDLVCEPLSSVDSTVDGVESIAVGARVTRGDLATSVRALTRGIDVAVGRHDLAAELAIVCDGDAGASVQGHIVLVLLVHALDDVDLTTTWVSTPHLTSG